MPLAHVLAARGIENLEGARLFFQPESLVSPDSQKMKGLTEAVERILRAIKGSQKIRLYGDYDVDGTTSISLLKHYFDKVGYPVDYYVPDRFAEGYGLSLSGIQKAEAEGVQLMIVMDCGTKELEKARFARSRGVDLIIVDHHRPGPELTDCEAFINPLQPGCEYPFKELSACGLTFKLAEALEGKLCTGTDLMAEFGELVALSIACDLVPVVGENRKLAAAGLKKLQTRPLPGIQALMNMSPAGRLWEMEDLIFFLGPRINSAGRREHASRAVDLLCGDLSVMDGLAQYLEESNEWRKSLDSQITEEAVNKILSDPEQKNKYSTVLFDETWHKGVIGIVASRLIETWYKPTVMLTRAGEHWVGSARSIEGFDLYEAMQECAPYILQFGGHKYAAGLTLQAENLLPFAAAFEKAVASRLAPHHPEPVLEIAAEADFSYLNEKFLRLLRKMGPFGPGNMEPIFLTRNVEVIDYKFMKSSHLKFNLRQGGTEVEAIGFNLASRWLKREAKRLDIAWQAGWNFWNGTFSIQLKIKDFKAIN